MNELVRNAFLDQYVEESENSAIYTFSGAWLKNKGLNNLGKMFLDGADEEKKHARTILDLLTDLNTPVEIRSIPDGDYPINSISDIANKFLQREEQTTQSLIEIRDLCIEHGEGISEELVRKMVGWQQNEMS
jgi:ferritin